MLNRRAWTALIIIFSILTLVGSLEAQSGYNIVDIEVEGNRRTSESLILGVASLTKGSPLSPTVVSETISRLYGLGIFSDVKLEGELVTGGLKVYIVVRELPKLIGLDFKNNKKFKSDDLKEKLKLGVGGYISPYLIHAKAEQIKSLYSEKGYFQAEVDHTLEYSTDSSEANLTFIINEQSKVKVKQVVLTGNNRILADDLIKKMRNRKRGFLRSSDFAQDKYEEDLEKVIAECHKKGYIDAYLISDSIHIDTTDNQMVVFLEIYEGPQYYFGKAIFKNNEALKTKILEKILKHKEGEVFDQEKYDESLMEIYTTYQEIGHLSTQVYDMRTTRADSIIDITYDITEGLPSHVNLVKIIGNTKTKEKVIRREISVQPTQIFNRTLLIRSIRDVMALNYFSNVTPNPIPLPNGDVDIEFKIEEKQTGQISAGAGYNSQDKLVGNLGLGIPNFRGNGQDISFNTEFGRNRNSFSVSFIEPWLYGRPTYLGTSAYILNRNWYDDYTEGSQGGSLKLGRRLRWPDNYFRVYASYRLERNRFYDFEDDYIVNNSYKAYHYYDRDDDEYQADSLLIGYVYKPYQGSVAQYNEDWLTSSSLSFTLTRDSKNLPEFATSGSVLSYTFEYSGFLGGFWKYQKHMISFSKFIPLFWKIALAAKVQYGVITSTEDDNHILISERFTPGGTAYDGIIRGYDDGDITPDSMVTQSDTVYYYYDPNAVVGEDQPDDTLYSTYRTRVRGKYMLVSNFEIQIPIVEQQIYALLFFDAGNSWLHRKDIKPFTGLYRSYGAGFRIVIPGMGTLGFDFGYALDDFQDEGKGWKPHFQIGTTFR